MSSGILVVAGQRDLRRRIFDVLDPASHAPIHSARGVPHAAILLEGQPELQLMVIVLDGDAKQSRAAIDSLRSLPGAREVPLIAVLADTSSLEPVDLAAGIVDWLHEGQIENELLARWRRWLEHPGAPVADRAAPVIGAAGRYSLDDVRGLLDEGESEWLVVARDTRRILDVSAALIRNSQLPASHWRGLALAEALSFEDVAVAGREDVHWRPCRRQSRHGGDTGQASLRPIQFQAQPALAIVFCADRADLRSDSALKLLAQVFAGSDGADATAAVGQLLFDALELDYLAVWSARRDGVDAAAPMLQLWRGDEPSWPQPSNQGSLQMVLAGKSMRYRADAQRLASIDPLVEELDLTGFVGLPLHDERQVVLGAMLAGSCKGFGPLPIVEPLLDCAAARFAQVLELGRTREQGRAEGLVDALTGLPNRLLFNDRLDTIIREANRNGECFALLFVDLDRFKDVNDSYGHAAGDHVLRTVTQRLCSSIRASDTVARYAGDEFTVVLRHIVKNDDVTRVAEKILQTMEAPLYLEDGTELTMTVSMGLSFFPDDATDAQTLLKHADEAMYAAKHQGRNNFQIYQISPEHAKQQGTALRSRLRHAEGNNELRVVYQPQVNAVSEDIVGMEALVRWEHPELGLISPAAFIPGDPSTQLHRDAMNFAIASTPARTGIETFERILAADSGLVVLDSSDAPELIEQLRMIARQSGQAVYLWEPDVGLSSLRDAHARVPDCERLGNALRYMQQSMHFGVFFLLGTALPLSASEAQHLRQLARAPKGHLRRVVLLNPPAALAEHLGDLAEHLSGADSQPRRLRLRDGRWLV